MIIVLGKLALISIVVLLSLVVLLIVAVMLMVVEVVDRREREKRASSLDSRTGPGFQFFVLLCVCVSVLCESRYWCV